MGIHESQSSPCDSETSMWSRSPWVRVVAVLGAAALGLLAACSGGGESDDAAVSEETVEKTVEADVDLTLGEVTVASAGPAVEMPPQIVERIETLVAAYVERATVIPLQTGEAGDLSELFTPFAAVSLDGPDHDSLVDDGVGQATADITASAARLNLNGLADQSGNVVLVAASLVLSLETETEEGPLQIVRLGDLVFVPAGFDWKISSYDMHVQRDGGASSAADDAETSPSRETTS